MHHKIRAGYWSETAGKMIEGEGKQKTKLPSIDRANALFRLIPAV